MAEQRERAPTDANGIRAALLVIGLRGDFQPFLALALELRRRGHDAWFLTSSDACLPARDFGFRATAVSGDFAAFMRGPECRSAMETGETGSITSRIYNRLVPKEEDATVVRDRLQRDMQDFKPTAVFFNALGEEAVPFVWRYCPGALRLSLELQPHNLPSNTYSSAFFQLEAPDEGMPNILTHVWALGLMDGVVPWWQESMEEGDEKEERLARFSRLADEQAPPEADFQFQFEPQDWLLPRFFGYSPSLFPRPSDWPESSNIRVVGPIHLDRQWQEEQVLAGGGFLALGSEWEQCKLFMARVGPPIYIGWDSMVVYGKEHMTRLAVEAARAAGEKAIILSGWAAMGMEGLAGAADEEGLRAFCQESVLFVQAAPLELLLPQCRAAVHHGGIGTLQASLLAACPTVVTPVFADQLGNGRHLAKTGCGLCTRRLGLLQPNELGEAIKSVVGAGGYRSKATAMAREMRKEDGLNSIMDYVESAHQTDFATGRYAQRLAAWKAGLFEKRERHRRMCPKALLTKFMSLVMQRHPAVRDYNARRMAFMDRSLKLIKAGKLWCTSAPSVLARMGEGLQTEEVGRFLRFSLLMEVEMRGGRLHVKKVKGSGPDSGWVTRVVKGRDAVLRVTDLAEVAKLCQQLLEAYGDRDNLA